MTILNSGGSDGADNTFGECARRIGHTVRHFAFRGMKSTWDGELTYLNPVNLHEADSHLITANKTLKRCFPCGSVYVDNLLRRNYSQIRDTHAVFAAAPLKDNLVDGGTGWTVQMAIDLHVPTLYLFDLTTNHWHQWLYSMSHWEYILFDDIHKPDSFSIYTGIGSRELTPLGAQAIGSLYR